MKQRQISAEREAEPVPFERDVQANPGFSNAKVLLEECEE